MPIFPSTNPSRGRPSIAPIYDEEDYEEEEWGDEDESDAYDVASAPLTEEDEEEDIAMLAVEERIEAANYLRALLTAELFGEDLSATARRVQRMVRGILRKELEVLLGIKQREAPVPVIAESPFSSEEIKVLKLLAARAREPRAQVAAVQPVTVPTPATVPTVSPINKPQVTATNVLTKNATAASEKTSRPVTKEKPPAKASPQKSAKSTKPQEAKPRPSTEGEAPTADPVSGMHVQMKGDVRRTKNGRVKRTMMVGDQKITNDLTPQVINPNRVPMPQGAQFTAITQMQAAETVAAQGGKASQIAAVALQS
jgi:hypothetical protein